LHLHVFQQLFIEALTITFLGGLIGFGLGWGLNAGLTALVTLLRTQNVQLMMLFSPENSFLASIITVLLMIVAGFLAGLTPALRAMRLDIVDSLRYE
jgi:putative ABC transport system permease protein